MARGKWIQMLDDDEVPLENCLFILYQTALQLNADGVWGKVEKHFNEGFPLWLSNILREEGFFKGNGPRLFSGGANTGNLLIKSYLLKARTPLFDLSLNFSGGEDIDAFSFISDLLKPRFVFTHKAIVKETIHLERAKLKHVFRRSLSIGWCLARYYSIRLGTYKAFLRTIPIIFLRVPGLFVISSKKWVLRKDGMTWQGIMFLSIRALADSVGRVLFFLGGKPDVYR